MSDDDLDDQLLTVGIKAPLGMATLSSFVRAGSIGNNDVMNYGVGIDLPVSEQLAFAVQYYTRDGEVTAAMAEDDSTLTAGDDIVDGGILEATAYYTVGDVSYYVSYLDYEAENADMSVVGAKVSF
jgi:hypothetical protein